ncbi:MAG: hypothetical protein ACXV3D_09980 [Halobacteriota archaeon]
MTWHRLLVCYLVLVALASPTSAGILPPAEREELIKTALKNFWGNAIVAKGQTAQPSSDTERNTVPIPPSVAIRVIDAGEISGLGEWCRLDWRLHYLSLTKAARAKGLSEKQVAFISFVYGRAQGRVADAMAKAPACSDQERPRVQQLLDGSRLTALDGT